MTTPILLTSDEAAAALQVSTKTLAKYRARGLSYVMLSPGIIRYRPDDLTDYIAKATQCHSAPKPRASGTMTSRSRVVDFTDLVAQKALRKPRP